MNKIINLLISLTLFCCLSCKTKHNLLFNENLIQRIAHEDQNLPSQFFNLFFCKCQSGEIVSLSVYDLREIYRNEYSGVEYSSFLSNLLNQRTSIQCKDRSDNFKIDENVRKRYEEMSLNEFLAFYCTERNQVSYYLKKDVTSEQRNTVLYFLFVNNYLTDVDDYAGFYVISKWDKNN
jgi:hypothetical protein